MGALTWILVCSSARGWDEHCSLPAGKPPKIFSPHCCRKQKFLQITVSFRLSSYQIQPHFEWSYGITVTSAQTLAALPQLDRWDGLVGHGISELIPKQRNNDSVTLSAEMQFKKHKNKKNSSEGRAGCEAAASHWHEKCNFCVGPHCKEFEKFSTRVYWSLG